MTLLFAEDSEHYRRGGRNLRSETPGPVGESVPAPDPHALVAWVNQFGEGFSTLWKKVFHSVENF